MIIGYRTVLRCKRCDEVFARKAQRTAGEALSRPYVADMTHACGGSQVGGFGVTEVVGFNKVELEDGYFES